MIEMNLMRQEAEALMLRLDALRTRFRERFGGAWLLPASGCVTFRDVALGKEESIGPALDADTSEKCVRKLECNPCIGATTGASSRVQGETSQSDVDQGHWPLIPESQSSCGAHTQERKGLVRNSSQTSVEEVGLETKDTGFNTSLAQSFLDRLWQQGHVEG
jgi:hypothetical protein